MNEPDLPDMRIGHAEREEALNALGTHMSAGRLDVDEYDDRSARVATARTRGDLIELFADLPAPKPTFDAAAPDDRPGPDPAVPAPQPGRRGISRNVTVPIIWVVWVSAIFIGPALGLHWLFGVAIAVTIILGSLTRKGSRHGDVHQQRHNDQ